MWISENPKFLFFLCMQCMKILCRLVVVLVAGWTMWNHENWIGFKLRNWCGVVLRCLFFPTRTKPGKSLRNCDGITWGEINFWVLFSSPQYVFEIAIYIGNLEEEIPDNFVASRESENFFHILYIQNAFVYNNQPNTAGSPAISGKSKRGGRSSRSFTIRGIKKSIMENT